MVLWCFRIIWSWDRDRSVSSLRGFLFPSGLGGVRQRVGCKSWPPVMAGWMNEPQWCGRFWVGGIYMFSHHRVRSKSSVAALLRHRMTSRGPRFGDAPPAPPRPKPKFLATASLAIFMQALWVEQAVTLASAGHVEISFILIRPGQMPFATVFTSVPGKICQGFNNIGAR